MLTFKQVTLTTPFSQSEKEKAVEKALEKLEKKFGKLISFQTKSDYTGTTDKSADLIWKISFSAVFSK